MTWLDERLFGWSHSAHRGTSAWGGGSSLDTSRASTPDMSDEEEEGDYDNVIDYLGSYVGTNLLQKRTGQRGSYADLHQVKHKDPASENQDGTLKASKSRGSISLTQAQYAPVYQRRPSSVRSPSSPITTNTSNEESMGECPSPTHRKSPRERRSTLSDRVAVEKIGELNPVDTFRHATEELNRDIADRSR